MQFTSAVALAVLAYTSSVQATPLRRGATPPPPALSLTQQLFIADTAVDRFALLPDNKDFIFDFNQPQAGPGAGGEIIAANRSTAVSAMNNC